MKCIIKQIIRKFRTKSNKLNENQSEIKDTSNLLCPTCGHDKWIELCGGGSYGNIECGKCKSKFNNLGIFGLQKI